MAFCPRCSKESQGSNFCPYCGASMGEAQPRAAAPPVPPAAPGTPAQPGTSQAPAGTAPPTIAPPAAPSGYAKPAAQPQGPGVLIFGIVGVISMLLAAAGSVLPWITGSISFSEFGGSVTFNASGWDKDGKITIFLAVLALAFFVVGLVGKSRWPFIVALVFSLILTGIMIVDIFDILGTTGFSFSNVGYGLIMGAVAGAIGVVAGIGGTAAKRA